MFRKAPAAPVDPPAPSSAKRRDDPLTEAQREFAQVLGRLLARRWLQQDPRKEAVPQPEEE